LITGDSSGIGDTTTSTPTIYGYRLIAMTVPPGGRDDDNASERRLRGVAQTGTRSDEAGDSAGAGEATEQVQDAEARSREVHPKSAHPGAKRALAEIWNAEDRDHARRAVAAFKLAYGAKFGKAVAKVVDDLDELLAFYDFPAEHWVHLRTTNPIESTFATVRHRTKVTKGAGSKADPCGVPLLSQACELGSVGRYASEGVLELSVFTACR
jgi:hypothetical protein